MASLWMVDDFGTARLMGDFYGALAAGKAPAMALRQAQIGALQKNDAEQTKAGVSLTDRKQKPGLANHPYYWAPFIVTGNGL